MYFYNLAIFAVFFFNLALNAQSDGFFRGGSSDETSRDPLAFTTGNVPSVYITLNMDNGSRVIVDPTNGGANDYASVTFELNDTIYVGNNGLYCGKLVYDGEKFAGTITPTSADNTDYLHFYFMGNKTPKIKQ